MEKNLLYDFSIDRENSKVYVSREFSADKQTVWKAWTDANILDQWWAPKPWKCETESQDFKVDGFWLYAMVGPTGEKHWARSDYQQIDAPNSYRALDAFCDENGNPDESIGRSEWTVVFHDQGERTLVDISLKFASEKDLDTHLEMGFEEGFASGMENLDAVLSK